MKRISIITLILSLTSFYTLAQGNECRVRILVLFSPDALTAAPGGASVKALAENCINETNTAMSNSGLATRVQLAGVIQISNDLAKESATEHPGAGLAEGMLYWLTEDATFGSVSTNAEVTNWKSYTSADVVYIIKGHGSNRARVWQIGPDAAHAYVVMDVRRMIAGDYGFSHELGHIFGSDHDPSNATINVTLSGVSSFGPRYSGAQGYQFQNAVSGFHDIMAYPCALCGDWASIPYYSNAAVNYNGHATGTAAQNAAGVINAQTNAVMNFSLIPGNLTINNLTVHAGELANIYCAGTLELNNVSLEAGADFSYLGQNVIIKSGILRYNGVIKQFVCNLTPAFRMTAATEVQSGQPDLISVYPNPSNGLFFVRATGDKLIDHVSVFSIEGKNVADLPFPSVTEARVDIPAQVAARLLIVRVTLSDGTIQTKQIALQ